MGLQPNADSALAFRARKGLRAEWVQSHATITLDDEHLFTLSNMGQFALGTSRKPTRIAIEGHLRGCATCENVLAEILDVVGRLGAMAPTDMPGESIA